MGVPKIPTPAYGVNPVKPPVQPDPNLAFFNQGSQNQYKAINPVAIGGNAKPNIPITPKDTQIIPSTSSMKWVVWQNGVAEVDAGGNVTKMYPKNTDGTFNMNPSSTQVTGTPTKTGITGIAPLDTELSKIQEDKTKAINDAYHSYTLAQADYQKNAGYYTNFNEVNGKYNNIIGDVKNALQQSGTATLTDEQYKQIADKYGIGIEDVKSPLNTFNELNPTDEGKRVLGISAREQQLTDMQTQFDRTKQDFATNLKNTAAAFDNQVADVQDTLKRNLDFATASGAWNGSLASSGYVQGLNNIKSDGQKTLTRLQQWMNQTSAANATNVNRVTEDFNKDITSATANFQDALKNLKHDSGLQLNGLTDKYGTGSKDLTKALDAIQEQFGAKSLTAFNNYITSVKGINEVTNSNIDQIKKLDDLQNSVAERRYNAYIANNGAVLQGASLSSMADEVKKGTLSQQQYSDLKNIMVSSITATLGKGGIVAPEDVNTITHLLESGRSPTEVIAQLKTNPKFSKKELDKSVDLGDKTRIYYNDGTYEDIEKTNDTKPISVANGSRLYDPVTKSFIVDPNATSAGGKNSIYSVNTTGGTDLSSKYTGSNGPAFANNNPGNIKDTAFGGTAGWQGGFTKFATAEEWVKALMDKLDYNKANGVDWVSNGSAYNGNMSLTQFFQKYAPSGDNNDPIAYARAVATGSGVSPNTAIKNIDTQDLAIGIMQHENWAFYRELHNAGIVTDEGINLKANQSTKTPATEKEYTTSDKAIMDDWLKDPGSKTSIAAMEGAGLKTADVNAYKSAKAAVLSDKIDPADMEVYNGLTPSDKKKLQNDPGYRQAVNYKNEVLKNPDASIQDIMDVSRGGKDLWETDGQQLAKYQQALNQLWPLQEAISKTDTGPILWALRSYNPYDTSAQSLKAQLNSLVPNLARGVYGEVGVLTDADIANYAKTVPNLKSTKDVNNAVLAMTLQAVANGYKSKLQTLASSGRDVSGFSGAYESIQRKVDDLMTLSGQWEKTSGGSTVKASNGKSYNY